MKCAIIVGTRPEIIKMASVIKACQDLSVPFYVLHTGQHYSFNMDGAFFRDLDLPEPAYNLKVGSGQHGEQTGRMLAEIEKVFQADRPGIALVQGDTNTVLAGALAATKLHIPVGHVEAGLRSYDRKMPEEINRVVADHISTHLFPPTEKSRQLLLGEGIEASKIYITGNTVADVVLNLIEHQRLEAARLKPFEVQPDRYVLVTAHRAENVDDPQRLAKLIQAIGDVAQKYGLVALYPCHPRTQARLKSMGMEMPSRIRLIEPVGLYDFLTLERFARIILTDSGGVQEEACICHVPCVTLRDSTERPETVDVGANLLAGIEPRDVMNATEQMIGRDRNWGNPFGDGTAGRQIVEIIRPLMS